MYGAKNGMWVWKIEHGVGVHQTTNKLYRGHRRVAVVRKAPRLRPEDRYRILCRVGAHPSAVHGRSSSDQGS